MSTREIPRVELQSKRNKSISPHWRFFFLAKTPHFNRPSLETIPQEKRGTYAPELQRAYERRSPAGQRCRETRQTIRDVYEGVQKAKHSRGKPFFWISRSLPLYMCYPLAV